jgi:hypothetical protein
MALPSDPGGGPPSPGMSVDQAYSSTDMTKIEVDITSISQFAEVLRREIEENLQPAWRRIEATLDKGGQFGLSPELSELHVKRLEYDSYLKSAKDLFRDVIEGVFQFAEGADQIAASYQRADQFAKVTAADVETAMPKVDQPPDNGGAARAM